MRRSSLRPNSDDSLIRLALALGALLVIAGCGRTGLWRFEDPDVDVGDIVDEPDAVDVGDGGFDVEVEEDVPPGVCGDGIVTADEECDDAELNSDLEPDACRTDCTFPRCGDGVVDMDEQCDDGDDVEVNFCDNECRAPAELCVPCDSDAECGRRVDRCVRHPDGRFCLTDCFDDSDCPDDYECRDVGEGTLQCASIWRVCSPCWDEDGDGYGLGPECLGLDCNDNDPAINPGAEEICDDIDNDCDELNDEVCPPDLIVDDETVEMSGAVLHDHVWIRNGGVIEIEPFDGLECRLNTGTEGTGCLTIDARIIEILPNSGIRANGAGGGGRFCGEDAGVGDGRRNSGPPGGGYGGEGGAGESLPGGSTYGTDSGDDIAQGSNGGDFAINIPLGMGGACDDLIGLVSVGGVGGGCVLLRAGTIIVDGFIEVNGADGEDAPDGRQPHIVDGAGGGSGGGILLAGETVRINNSGRLSAQGGDGGTGGRYDPTGMNADDCVGHGGGGGGGGRIKIFADNLTLRGNLNVREGQGAEGPQSNSADGDRGTIHTTD